MGDSTVAYDGFRRSKLHIFCPDLGIWQNCNQQNFESGLYEKKSVNLWSRRSVGYRTVVGRNQIYKLPSKLAMCRSLGAKETDFKKNGLCAEFGFDEPRGCDQVACTPVFMAVAIIENEVF